MSFPFLPKVRKREGREATVVGVCGRKGELRGRKKCRGPSSHFTPLAPIYLMYPVLRGVLDISIPLFCGYTCTKGRSLLLCVVVLFQLFFFFSCVEWGVLSRPRKKRDQQDDCSGSEERLKTKRNKRNDDTFFLPASSQKYGWLLFALLYFGLLASFFPFLTVLLSLLCFYLLAALRPSAPDE